MKLLVAVGVTAAVSAACGPSEDAPAASSPATPPTTTTASVPSEFPDMSAFAVVDTAKYLEIAPPTSAYHFSTTGGLSCFLDGTGMIERAYASCTGPRKDLGAGVWKVTATPAYGATFEEVDPNDPDSQGSPGADLARGSVLRKADDQYCGVDADNTVACRVGEHGFVLTPTESTFF